MNDELLTLDANINEATKEDHILLPQHHTMSTSSAWAFPQFNLLPCMRLNAKEPLADVSWRLSGRMDIPDLYNGGRWFALGSHTRLLFISHVI